MQERVVPYPTSAGKVTGTGNPNDPNSGGWGTGDLSKGIMTQGVFTLNQGNIAVDLLANTFVPGALSTALDLLRNSLNNPKISGDYTNSAINEGRYGHLWNNPVNLKDDKAAGGGSYRVK